MPRRVPSVQGGEREVGGTLVELVVCRTRSVARYNCIEPSLCYFLFLTEALDGSYLERLRKDDSDGEDADE
jgi:hypothetical protein